MQIMWQALSGSQINGSFPFHACSYIPYSSGITAIAYSIISSSSIGICKLSHRYSIIYGAVFGTIHLILLKIAATRFQPGAGGQLSTDLKITVLAGMILFGGLSTILLSMGLYGNLHLLSDGIKKAKIIDQLCLHMTSMALSELLYIARAWLRRQIPQNNQPRIISTMYI